MRRPDLQKEWVKHLIRDNLPHIIMREGESIQQMKEIGFRSIKVKHRSGMSAFLTARK